MSEPTPHINITGGMDSSEYLERIRRGMAYDEPFPEDVIASLTAERDAALAECAALKAEMPDRPEWTCCECGGQEVRDVVHRSIQEPDDYDIECLQCESLRVCESPREALFESIRQVEKLEEEVAALKAARPKVRVSLNLDDGACFETLEIDKHFSSEDEARAWAEANGFEVIEWTPPSTQSQPPSSESR